MTSLGTLSRSTAGLLLVTAAACGDSTTEAARERASPSPAPDVTSLTGPPPTLDIEAVGGIGPLLPNAPPTARPGDYYSGAFYRIDVNGAGFPPGQSWNASIMVVLLDGTVIRGAGGTGLNPADGSFRMVYSGNCPSRFRDVYAFVVSGGRTTESKHIVPTC